MPEDQPVNFHRSGGIQALQPMPTIEETLYGRLRREFWERAFFACIREPNAMPGQMIVAFADNALREWDARWKEQTTPPRAYVMGVDAAEGADTK